MRLNKGILFFGADVKNFLIIIFLLLQIDIPVYLLAQDNWVDDKSAGSNKAETKSENGEAASSKNAAATELENNQYKESEEIRTASSNTVRKFHEVLDELLAEFGHDIKMGQINGLKNLSVRKVDVSDALPDTYKNYTELLVLERIRENSRIRIISCLPCKSKTSSLIEGKISITSPTTNIARLDQAADQLGIDNFMDIVLVYHTTHMVLAMQIFNSKTKEMVWARTYNSETIKSRFQKLAIDYSQVAKARTTDEYVPEYRFLLGLGGAAVPNIGGTSEDSVFVDAQFRGSEKFNNRKSEFGLLLDVFMSTTTFLSNLSSGKTTSTSSTTTTADEESETVEAKPFTTAIGLYGFYAQNFVGSVESYNDIRQGANIGIGFLTAVGYFTGTVRGGWDMYFGRRFAVNFGMLYILPSTIKVDGESIKTQGGFGGGVTISAHY